MSYNATRTFNRHQEHYDNLTPEDFDNDYYEDDIDDEDDIEEEILKYEEERDNPIPDITYYPKYS